MRPGPMIRRLFGPYERSLTEAYRRLFVDLDDFAQHLRTWVPEATKILEVGCGEGAMTERLVRTYPDAVVTGIDMTPNVGRLFRGDRNRALFLRKSVQDIARDEPGSFDLVILCDVLHHVVPRERESLLAAIDHAMTPGGSLAFKDWAPSFGPIHWLCLISDRYITGDAVQFCSAKGARALLSATFSEDAIRREALIKPWANNISFLVER